MSIAEPRVALVPGGETKDNDDPTAKVWVDAEMWDDAEELLN